MIIPPMSADYGCNTFIGKNTFVNMNAIFLDCARITLEDNVMLGPNVNLFTASHPVREEERRQIPGVHEGLEFALPIVIKKGAWLGGNVTVLPGVTIGERAVIGAGSVVTRDIPADVVAAGSPARVLRKIDQREELPEEDIVALEREAEDPKMPPARRLLAQYTADLQRERQGKKKEEGGEGSEAKE